VGWSRYFEVDDLFVVVALGSGLVVENWYGEELAWHWRVYEE